MPNDKLQLVSQQLVQQHVYISGISSSFSTSQLVSWFSRSQYRAGHLKYEYSVGAAQLDRQIVCRYGEKRKRWLELLLLLLPLPLRVFNQMRMMMLMMQMKREREKKDFLLAHPYKKQQQQKKKKYIDAAFVASNVQRIEFLSLSLSLSLSLVQLFLQCTTSKVYQ